MIDITKCQPGKLLFAALHPSKDYNDQWKSSFGGLVELVSIPYGKALKCQILNGNIYHGTTTLYVEEYLFELNDVPSW